MVTVFEIFRKKKRLTQAELGKALGVGQSAISQYETQARLPEIRIARRFIDVAANHGEVYEFDEIFRQVQPDKSNAA